MYSQIANSSSGVVGRIGRNIPRNPNATDIDAIAIYMYFLIILLTLAKINLKFKTMVPFTQMLHFSISGFVDALSGALWGWPTIILLFGTHIYLTVILKFPQRKIFKGIKLSFTRDEGSSGDVSQFGALATSLAATIGTGNIIGVATAITLGGPGAVLWCWMAGFFGIATKYSEGLLAIKYRVKSHDGTMIGGPMYALERGLKMKWLAVLFCVFTAIAAFGIGNSVQSNAIASLLAHPVKLFIELIFVAANKISLLRGITFSLNYPFAAGFSIAIFISIIAFCIRFSRSSSASFCAIVSSSSNKVSCLGGNVSFTSSSVSK